MLRSFQTNKKLEKTKIEADPKTIPTEFPQYAIYDLFKKNLLYNTIQQFELASNEKLPLQKTLDNVKDMKHRHL